MTIRNAPLAHNTLGALFVVALGVDPLDRRQVGCATDLLREATIIRQVNAYFRRFRAVQIRRLALAGDQNSFVAEYRLVARVYY